MLIKIKQAGFLVVLVCLSWIFTSQATVAIADSPDSLGHVENPGPTDPAEVKRFMDSFWIVPKELRYTVSAFLISPTLSK